MEVRGGDLLEAAVALAPQVRLGDHLEVHAVQEFVEMRGDSDWQSGSARRCGGSGRGWGRGEGRCFDGAGRVGGRVVCSGVENVRQRR